MNSEQEVLKTFFKEAFKLVTQHKTCDGFSPYLWIQFFLEEGKVRVSLVHYRFERYYNSSTRYISEDLVKGFVESLIDSCVRSRFSIWFQRADDYWAEFYTEDVLKKCCASVFFHPISGVVSLHLGKGELGAEYTTTMTRRGCELLEEDHSRSGQ